jgi:flagellar biosynthesis/type III secretory pathway M-ring protein FliF/YscJ
MRVLALVVAIVVLLVLFWVARQLMARAAARQAEEARWEPMHHSLPGGGVEVCLERAGEESLPLARLDPLAADFEDRLHEAMAEARARAAALNSERPALRR